MCGIVGAVCERDVYGILIEGLKKNFDTQSWHVGNFARNGSMGNIKFDSEISMKTFVSTKVFYAL